MSTAVTSTKVLEQLTSILTLGEKRDSLSFNELTNRGV